MGLVRTNHHKQMWICKSHIVVELSLYITHHAAEVAAHKDVIERGQLQVRSAQVTGQLQAFAVRYAAAPVRRTQRARAWGAVI